MFTDSMTIARSTKYSVNAIVASIFVAIVTTGGSCMVVVNGQHYHPLCDIFGSSEMPKAPFVSVTSWDLPISANTNWSGYVTQRVMSISGYAENTSYCDATTGDPMIEFKPVHIGDVPQMMQDDIISIVDEAYAAYNHGAGNWTSQTTVLQRIQMIRSVLSDIELNREEMVRLLMWESSKNFDDANTELDSVLEYFDQIVYIALNDPQYNKGVWEDIDGGRSGPTTTALTKRTALGVVLITTYNHHFAELYRLLLPALLTGNVVIFKIPVLGGLIHLFTQKIFATYLPNGSIYFVSGPGPMVLPHIVGTGKIDAMALFGGNIDPTHQLLIKIPNPHRVKIFLQSPARNVAIVLPDLFDMSKTKAYYKNAMTEMIDGSLTYSGMLNTALKFYFVPRAYADRFVLDLAERVEKLSIGLPWQTHVVANDDDDTDETRTEYSKIVPIPDFSRVAYLQERMEDAIRKGARVINEKGGIRIGTSTTSLLRPAILYPIRSNMSFFHDESVGPIILVAPYDTIDEAYDFLYHNSMSQQISIFGKDVTTISTIIDRFSSVVGRININTKCSQEPDVLPFAVRRHAGMGTLSVTDVLKELTVPTVLSHKSHDLNEELVDTLTESSIFLGNAKATVE